MTQIVGNSEWANSVRDMIAQVARFGSSVLIAGPSGTGKELIARRLHLESPRSERPFVPVDCASIPGTLFASQLFGHVKGAFTGANAAALGCFRAAEGGTVFLDEIGELDLELQSSLLRVIQERRVTPLGSHESHPIDVRIVAATNRNLSQEVAAGRFRLDLYYRLNVVSLESAPLASRRGDVLLLAEHFLQNICNEFEIPLKRFTPAAAAALLAYSWPGNVRELQNVVERAIVLTDGEEIDSKFIPRDGSETTAPTVAVATTSTADRAPQPQGDFTRQVEREVSGDWQSLAENERDHLRRTLEFTHYNQSAAARLLEIDYRLLQRRIKKYRIDIPAAK
ncbi:MAG: sigma-54 dependent transcriptional regulator [Pirellulales bacterium]